MTVQAHAFPRSDRSRLGVWWWTTDHWLLGATAALIGLGVVLQFGTSPAAASRLGIAWTFHFAVRQCIFAAGGENALAHGEVERPGDAQPRGGGRAGAELQHHAQADQGGGRGGGGAVLPRLRLVRSVHR